MKESEVYGLSSNGLFQGKPLHGKVEETHISWVILTHKYAFKLKKPLKLSFLDFSTLQLRKYYCEKEIELNARFTNIYLDIVPVCFAKGRWYFGNGRGELIDYAVRMKRLMTAKRMDKVLGKGPVHRKYLTDLAGVITSFHTQAKRIHSPFDLQEARNTFNDICLARDFVSEHIGIAFAEIIDKSINWSDNFLTAHAHRFQRRIDQGFKRDVHGDLHCGNIFLYRTPVLFDCIEFNDQYRQIDVLYEIAFLSMDLDALHQKQLGKILLWEYRRKFPCFEVREDEDLFIYFKLLRANVRAKVHAMSAGQVHEPDKMKYHKDETKKYLALMRSYLGHFSQSRKT